MSDKAARSKSRRGVRPRAAEVAELAGVSRSAVSRAFSLGAYIAPETKAKVMEAAAALNYRPDTLASSLAKGNSSIVALVFNQVNTVREPGFHSALLRAVQDSGRLPIVLSLSPTDDGERSLKQYLTFPVEGLIVLSDSVSMKNALAAVPYVQPIMMNFERNRMGEDSFLRDDSTGIFQMVDHLWETGHRSVGFMAGRPTSLSSNVRRDALQVATKKKKMRLTGEARGDFDYRIAYDATPELVTTSDRPDAIFCANDLMALAVMDYLRLETTLRVPEDISIVGFDDVMMAGWPIYNLSSIRVDVESVAAATIALLDRRRDPSINAERWIPAKSELVLRGSIRTGLEPI